MGLILLSSSSVWLQILRRPRIGAGNRVMDMIREPYRLTRVCEVTAILILYGLPRYYCYHHHHHHHTHVFIRNELQHVGPIP